MRAFKADIFTVVLPEGFFLAGLFTFNVFMALPAVLEAGRFIALELEAGRFMQGGRLLAFMLDVVLFVVSCAGTWH